jgi:hypothetical protein
MSVRLNKVCRELNVGLQTLCDFLSDNGYDIMPSPTFKLTDEQAVLVYEHFGGKQYVPQSQLTSSNNNPPSIKAKTSPPQDFDWDQFESLSSSDEASDRDPSNSLPFNSHEIVSATITAIDRREVVVNVGYKTDAIIPASELRYNPEFKVGDKIEVYIEDIEDKHGRVVVSHKKARLNMSWDKINEANKNDETIKVYVKSRTKGGLIVDAFGIEAFLPDSQIDIVKVFDFDSYVGKTLDVKIIQINTEFRNVVVSHKEVVSENLQKRSTDKTLLKDIWQKHTEV